eukprot:scaffold38271_cov29-Tisochrysis_lutea.AAC.2
MAGDSTEMSRSDGRIRQRLCHHGEIPSGHASAGPLDAPSVGAGGDRRFTPPFGQISSDVPCPQRTAERWLLRHLARTTAGRASALHACIIGARGWPAGVCAQLVRLRGEILADEFGSQSCTHWHKQCVVIRIVGDGCARDSDVLGPVTDFAGARALETANVCARRRRLSLEVSPTSSCGLCRQVSTNEARAQCATLGDDWHSIQLIVL